MSRTRPRPWSCPMKACTRAARALAHADGGSAVSGPRDAGRRGHLQPFATLRGDGHVVQAGADSSWAGMPRCTSRMAVYGTTIGAACQRGRNAVVHACTVGDDCVVQDEVPPCSTGPASASRLRGGRGLGGVLRARCCRRAIGAKACPPWRCARWADELQANTIACARASMRVSGQICAPARTACTTATQTQVRRPVLRSHHGAWVQCARADGRSQQPVVWLRVVDGGPWPRAATGTRLQCAGQQRVAFHGSRVTVGAAARWATTCCCTTAASARRCWSAWAARWRPAPWCRTSVLIGWPAAPPCRARCWKAAGSGAAARHAH
jgi:hypothetical protein